jgi:acetyl-CoA synthetase
VVRGRHAERFANCVDRHLKTRGDQVAIIWEGDDPNDDKKITYKELTSRSAGSPT